MNSYGSAHSEAVARCISRTYQSSRHTCATSTVKDSIKRYAEILKKESIGKTMVVFLCGPSLSDKSNPGVPLRERLEKKLAASGFEVVLGEDDGLADLQKTYNKYAHVNELLFIQKEAAAVVLIASSVGAYCELGLFAFEHPQATGESRDFILIIDEKYKGAPSYLRLGPAQAIEDFGKVYYVNLSTFDENEVVERLARRRAVWFSDKRGRPNSR